MVYNALKTIWHKVEYTKAKGIVLVPERANTQAIDRALKLAMFEYNNMQGSSLFNHLIEAE